MAGKFIHLLMFLIISFNLSSSDLPSNFTSKFQKTWINSNNSDTQTVVFSNGKIANLILFVPTSIPLVPLNLSLGFACGFYCNPPSPLSCLVAVLAVELANGTITDLGSPQVVWSANRDRPVGENATLQLAQDGALFLADSNGTSIWNTGTPPAGNYESGVMVTRTGNLSLFNKYGTIWLSSNYPTDTLLSNQYLVNSSVTPKLSQGPFFLSPVSNGLAAFIQGEPPQKYLQIVPPKLGENCEITSVGLRNGSLRFPALCNGTSRRNFYYPIKKASFPQFLRLDFDGHMRVYEWKKLGLWEPVYDFSKGVDDCQYPLACGVYGVCNKGQCSCPKALNGVQYFRESSSQLQKHGCEEIANLTSSHSNDQYQLVDFGNLSYFTYIDPEAAIPDLKDLEGCKRACAQNLSCKAAFFKYENNSSDGYCYLPHEIFSIRENPLLGSRYNSAAFITVKVPSIRKGRRLIIVVVIFGIVATSFIIFVVGMVLLKKKKENDDVEYDFHQLPGMPTRFSYQDLRTATKNFSEKIGGGGFGDVFKGVLGDGMQIAVKRLDRIGQGMREFLAEVETAGIIQHINIVRLIGFCAENSCRLLVYEYMSNGSLDKWIFDNAPKCVLDWKTKQKILLDIAKGLAYLHEECGRRIAHLDIKPQNILLDENFNAKVSDFGLSKVIGTEQSRTVTTLRGTFGYLAPEWLRSKITLKVDTYSFGIVVLEIVCGRKNLDLSQPESGVHLLSIIQKKADEGQVTDIVEMQNFDNQCHREEVMKMIRIAVWCLHDDHTRRPSMSTVVKVLEGHMELESDIGFRFSQTMSRPPPNADIDFSSAPQAFLLSTPR